MSIVQSGLPLALLVPFILAPWIAFMHRHRVTTSRHSTANATPEASAEGRVDPGVAEASVDLSAILHGAVLAVNALARACWVQIELAVGAAVTVPGCASAVRTALSDTLVTAINATPGGQVLVTAAMSDSGLQIRITDDGPGTDQQAREKAMGETEGLIVAQGGSIVVEARQGLGTTVTIAVPMPAVADQQASGLTQRPELADQTA